VPSRRMRPSKRPEPPGLGAFISPATGSVQASRTRVGCKARARSPGAADRRTEGFPPDRSPGRMRRKSSSSAARRSIPVSSGARRRIAQHCAEERTARDADMAADHDVFEPDRLAKSRMFLESAAETPRRDPVGLSR